MPGGAALLPSRMRKKNGSIDALTGVVLFVPSRPNGAEVVRLRWKRTPLGKFAGSGVLFAQKTP